MEEKKELEFFYQLSTTNDDERTKFMFSSFPTDKFVNPTHWESKLNFWTSEIARSCRLLGDICVSFEKLKSRFLDKDKRSPAGLSTVVNELYNSGELIKCSTGSISQLVDKGWGKWSYQVAKNSAGWVWGKVWSGAYDTQTVFVLKELIEEYCVALLDAHYKRVKYEKTDNVVPWSVVKGSYKINGQLQSEENLGAVIVHLHKSGKVKVATFENGELVIKFKIRNEARADPVTENDLQIVKLKKSIAKLSIENEKTEKEVERLKLQAQQCLKNKDQLQAKKILAQKLKLVKSLNMKEDALTAMKSHLRTVQECETTKMITDAFNSSATLIKDSYKNNGLTVENVEDIMDQTEEVRDMVNEVEEALASGTKRLDEDVDLDDLERELAELEVREDTPLDESLNLPDVPEPSPRKQVSKEKRTALPA